MYNSIIALLTPYLLATLLSVTLSVLAYLGLKLTRKEAYKMRTLLLVAPLFGSAIIMVIVFSHCFSHWLSINGLTLCLTPCGSALMQNVSLICTIFVTIGAVSFGSASILGILNYFIGDKVVIRLLHAIPFTENDGKQVLKMLNHLSRKAKVKPPKLFLVERSAPMIFTVGNKKAPVIVVSVGLLETLSSKEVNACFAHEISHIKNNDSILAALTLTLKLSASFIFPGYLIQPAILREREFLADECSISLTNDVSSLISALIKITQAYSTVTLSNAVSNSHVFSLAGLSRIKIFSTHPTLEERLTRLLTLDG